MLTYQYLFYLSVIFYSLYFFHFNPPVQSVKSCCIMNKIQFNFANFNFFFVGQVCTILVGIFWLISSLVCYLNVVYVTFDTNLNILKKSTHKNMSSSKPNEHLLWWLLLAIIATETSFDINFAIFIHFYSGSSLKLKFSLHQFCRSASLFACFGTYFYISLIAVTPATYFIALILTYVLCTKLIRNVPG